MFFSSRTFLSRRGRAGDAAGAQALSDTYHSAPASRNIVQCLGHKTNMCMHADICLGHGPWWQNGNHCHGLDYECLAIILHQPLAVLYMIVPESEV